MTRLGLAAVMAAAVSSASCGGGTFGAHASVSVSAEIQVPIAKMPPKYASWVVEAEGYLQAVNQAYDMEQQATADLAAALGVQANADAIAQAIRDAIKVKTKLVCQPPSFSANLVADCTAKASARAAGNAGNGGAAGEASAGIKANCEASASLSLKPGSCTLETTVSQNPILSDAARWAKLQTSMKVILQLHAANAYLNGRGAGINQRGIQLYGESVTDLAKDPTLALQLNNIQAELKKGADAVGAANDKQAAMNNDLGMMTDAIDAQFPDLSASISASMN